MTATGGNSEVTLSWTAAADGGSAVTGHEYQQKTGSGRLTASGRRSRTSAPDEANATSYTVSGLTNGTQYSFKVRAVNGVGDGAASGEDSATPVALSLTLSGRAVTVTEASGAGNTATYTVALSAVPSGEVTVGVTSGNTNVATVSPVSLTFTTDNWSAAQTVTVTGVSDSVIGDRTVSITHTLMSTDSVVSGVTVTDDDHACRATASLAPDCEALLAAKNPLRGTATLNWRVDVALADWVGVTTSSGRVTGLRLSRYGLTGTIPAELGKLTALTYLDLYDNNLTGDDSGGVGRADRADLSGPAHQRPDGRDSGGVGRADRTDLSGSV